MKLKSIFLRKKAAVSSAYFGACVGLSQSTFAASGDQTLGGVASQITQSFTSVTKLITALSYLAGLGFFIAAIFKFKEHKDNSAQVSIGKPIALVAIAAGLLFMPSVMNTIGFTMFSSPTTASATGTAYTP